MKSWWSVVALAATLGACGDSNSNTPAPDAGPMVCRRAFEATVTGGPDMGTMVFGTLNLTPTSATTLTGFVDPYVPSDGGAPLMGQITQRVPVTGTIAGNQLTLTFTLPDGRTMSGTGTLPSSTWSCPNELTGTLTGPGMGDTGDWATRITVTVCVGVGSLRACGTVTVEL